MKNRTISTFAAILLLALIPGIASPALATPASDKNTADQVKKETKELLQALKSYTVVQRDEALDKSRSTLEHLDQRIDALEKRVDKDWDKMDRTARANARASLQELRRQRTKVAEWFGGLKSSSIEAWGNMKEGFSDAFTSLHQAWEKSEKEFSNSK